ncbi:MAG: hypothetical protein IPN93_03050 [Bacteroidetes bacterium]|mgnify:FL=1|nr:hypothetical protein [Bacteroidota bacterium]MBK8671981.1 hypothetical protein [Bacteroidota bacterium]MBK9355576.1 hypothetical protein [Bacteroidota bacterium]MBK9634067.1 hypothetical protein [Bacteroidota bacterium]
MELDDLINKVTDITTSITDKIDDWKTDFFDDEKQNIIQEFRDNTKEKISAILNDLQNSTKLIENIGYDFVAFNIDLGIPPSVQLIFEVLPLKAEKIEAQLPEDINLVIKIVLKALLRTNALAQSIKLNDFECKQVTLTMGLNPDIVLNYKKKLKNGK